MNILGIKIKKVRAKNTCEELRVKDWPLINLPLIYLQYDSNLSLRFESLILL